ncbi:hypothetical protein OTSTA716_1091 [Orientia tsutsugamushi str. TA716]|uniref:IS5 family transposase ISOt6 n=1 Tax=Orientia tsutsugamushi str. TA716 TaxID=1359175 RepID=A0A0F3P5T7_ORITS|nr:hypothetical protein OTSTA716_1091 [Orientia tsutsugamushi str. TA716]
MITDTGYQGIQKIHNNSELPKKNKKNPLTKNDKKNNLNRCKRFGLRFNLISGIYNFELP